MRQHRLVAAVSVVILAASCGNTPERITRLDFAADRTAANPEPARGPLRVSPENPRYFIDGSGKAIFLTGSHTWDNRQDIGSHPFDWTDYLTRLRGYNHNFVRLWVWEQPKGLTTTPDPAEPTPTMAPELFSRTGPGVAADGRLKFDLTKYNAAHLGRLRQRILDAARERRITVVGPNSVGVVNLANGVVPTISQYFDRKQVPYGPLALVSQSGAFGPMTVRS